MHLMNGKLLASLYSPKPRMFVFMLSNWRLSFPSEETCYAVHWVLWPHIPMWSLIHSAKRCLHSKYICDSMLQKETFLLCTPLCTSPAKNYVIWCWYEGESNENLKYFLSRNLLNTKVTQWLHGWYSMLIYDSYPDVWLFHPLLCGNFFSQWLQLLQWPLVSLFSVPGQVKESLLQN